MKPLRAIVIKATSLLEIICVFMLCVCTLSAFIGVVMRYLLNRPFNWIEEVSALSLCWLVFLFQPKLENEYNQLSMAVFFNSRGRGYKNFVRILQSILTIGLGGYLFYHAVLIVRMNIATHQITPALEMPWWILYMIMPLSFAGLVIIHLIKLITNDFLPPAEQKKEDVDTCC